MLCTLVCCVFLVVFFQRNALKLLCAIEDLPHLQYPTSVCVIVLKPIAAAILFQITIIGLNQIEMLKACKFSKHVVKILGIPNYVSSIGNMPTGNFDPQNVNLQQQQQQQQQPPVSVPFQMQSLAMALPSFASSSLPYQQQQQQQPSSIQINAQQSAATNLPPHQQQQQQTVLPHYMPQQQLAQQELIFFD